MAGLLPLRSVRASLTTVVVRATRLLSLSPPPSPVTWGTRSGAVSTVLACGAATCATIVPTPPTSHRNALSSSVVSVQCTGTPFVVSGEILVLQAV